VLNSLIDDKKDVQWGCDVCEDVTTHDLIDETVTRDSGDYYIDTIISCIQCGHEQDVTEAASRDPR